MKKNKFYQGMLEDNIANKEYKLQNVLSNYKKRFIKYKILPFRLVAASLALTTVLGYNLLDVTNNYSKVFARTVENKDFFNAGNSKIDLKVNVGKDMPSKITQGKLISYVNKNGEEIKEYEVNFESDLRLLWSGANIKSITYSSINGELYYFDDEMFKKMENNGQIYLCKITFPNSKVGSDLSIENVEKAFTRMWKAGEFDEYKNKYFEGKDINLDSHSYGFGCEIDYESGNSVITFYKPQQETQPYMQRGSKIKVNGNNKGEFSFNWLPVKAMDVLKKENFYSNYKNLPSDTVTAEVELEDGQVITKIINLSFDKEGNLAVEVTK